MKMFFLYSIQVLYICEMVLDYFELVINLLEIKQRRLKNLLACVLDVI